eukprot:7078355-Karenia_brevis.AAC.1
MDCKTSVEAMNGVFNVCCDALRSILVRTAQDWDRILTTIQRTSSPEFTFDGMSPLKWVERSLNVQADFLCHYTLELQKSWQQDMVQPGELCLSP